MASVHTQKWSPRAKMGEERMTETQYSHAHTFQSSALFPYLTPSEHWSERGEPHLSSHGCLRSGLRRTRPTPAIIRHTQTLLRRSTVGPRQAMNGLVAQSLCLQRLASKLYSDRPNPAQRRPPSTSQKNGVWNVEENPFSSHGIPEK